MTGAEALQKIIDTINELTITVNGLKDSINFIEANIKILNNRAGGLIQEQKKIMPQLNNNLIMADAPIQKSLLEDIPDKPGVMTYKKVFGKLIDNAKDPIQNVLIKIYDKNNEVCATAETDPAGYWETMLKIGRYIAEYTKPGFKTANKAFEVGSNSKEIEVK